MKKRLYCSKTDKKLCGVCAGVADYFGIDPTIVRVIWALLAFFYGTSILLYVIMALVVPEQPAGGGVIDVDSEVRGPEKCYLIPAVQDIFIVDIDAEKREIYVKMIEGLETNAD